MWILQTLDSVVEPTTFRISPGAVKTIGRSTGAELILDAATAWPTFSEDDLATLADRAVATAFHVGLESAGFDHWEADAALSVAFLDDARVARLNQDFRNKPESTNVQMFRGAGGQGGGLPCLWWFIVGTFNLNFFPRCSRA